MSRLETLDVGDSEALNAGGLDDDNEAAEQRAKERLLNAVDGGGGGAAGKPRQQRPKFTEANLVDPALGLPWLMSEMPRACAGLGKRGDEAASARHLVHLYKRWCFAMFPALAFKVCDSDGAAASADDQCVAELHLSAADAGFGTLAEAWRRGRARREHRAVSADGHHRPAARC